MLLVTSTKRQQSFIRTTSLQNVTALHVIPYVMSSGQLLFRSDNGTNFGRVITLGCDNGSKELEAIIFLLSAKALCDKTNVT
jgi:hypothetical protein